MLIPHPTRNIVGPVATLVPQEVDVVEALAWIFRVIQRTAAHVETCALASKCAAMVPALVQRDAPTVEALVWTSLPTLNIVALATIHASPTKFATMAHARLRGLLSVAASASVLLNLCMPSSLTVRATPTS